MKTITMSQALGWFSLALAGVIAPVFALLSFADNPDQLARAAGPAIALGLMGVGIIGAALVAKLWLGVGLALINGAVLFGLAYWLGLPPQTHGLLIVVAIIVACLSFAARGVLFTKSALDKGWVIALFVVAGEAAILMTAIAKPGALPDWLLALLPAQWATTAIQIALAGQSAIAAIPVLLALAGTAGATLLVAKLWPKRWTYTIMFSTWLALSALVYHWPYS